MPDRGKIILVQSVQNKFLIETRADEAVSQNTSHLDSVPTKPRVASIYKLCTAVKYGIWFSGSLVWDRV